MNCYDSTLTLESKIIPGVRFTIRKPSIARWREIAQWLGSVYGQLGICVAEHRQLAANPDHNLVRMIALGSQIFTLTQMIDPVWITQTVESIEGLEIDGQPATPESLTQKGPPELCGEILRAVRDCYADAIAIVN